MSSNVNLLMLYDYVPVQCQYLDSKMSSIAGLHRIDPISILTLTSILILIHANVKNGSGYTNSCVNILIWFDPYP